MRLGVISDIHGNDIALEAVLAFLLPRTDHIVCAGDVTGYYTRPARCLALLLEHGIPFVRGNHDTYLFHPREGLCADHLASLEMARAGLDQAGLDRLGAAPCAMELLLGGRRISMIHGGPADPCEEYVYPDSDHDRCFDTDADLVILGHTHWPMAVRRGDKLLLNPGSVGQPRDHRPGASCAVVDLDTLAVDFYKIPFNAAVIEEELAQKGLPSYFADYLRHGRRFGR